MTTDTERLIELASGPLADNAELHLASVALLQENLAAHAASGDAVAEAIGALEDADQNPSRRHWRIGLYLAAFAAVVVVVAFAALQAYPAYQALRLFRVRLLDGDTENHLDRYTAGLNHDQKLLLFGRKGATNETERWKPLWESAPENPAFLAQYAAAYARDNEKLSPEILEAVQRIDPNNGWYPALSAGWIMKDVVITKRQTPKKNKSKVWEIKDKSKLDEALRLIHQAAEKPEFSNYESAMFKQRISLLPPRTDWTSQFPRACYVASQKLLSYQIFNISKALSAGAQECAANKDVEGFRRIVGDWQKLGPAMTRNGATFMDLLVAKSCITTPLKNFSETAHALGLEEEAAHFDKLDEVFAEYNDARQSSRFDSEFISLAENRSSMLARLSIFAMLEQVEVPPPITDADLRPSRYAEHAFFSRVATTGTWVVFVIFIGLAALCRFFKSPLVRTLASRMADLLRLSDWLWIVLGGVLLPMLWYLFIVHLTPLGSREWSIMDSEMFLPTGQFVAMLLLVIILPSVIAGWRLEKQGAMFGLRSRFQWIGWLAVGSTATAIPAFGSGMLMPQMTFDYLQLTVDSLPLIAITFFSIPALWLMVVFFLNLFGRSEQSLRRATLAGLMMPVWTIAILAFAVWTPFLYILECRWMQQDRLLEISADAPSLTRYEYDVTQVLRAEILEIMNRKP